MSIFTGLFAKVAGSAVGSFFGTYKFIILGVLAAALAGAVSYYVYTAERAKGQVSTLSSELENIREDYKGLLISVDINEAALQHCRTLNIENNKALEHQKQVSQDAMLHIKLLQQESVHTVEDIHDEGKKLRGQDTECRAVDDPLPDFFIVGLYQ